MNTLGIRALLLISQYSKPITRGDWRTCKPDIFEEIVNSPVFDVYFHKQHAKVWKFKGNPIFNGRGRYRGYITSRNL